MDHIIAGYKSAGFLAYLSSDVVGNDGPFDPILFDTEVYDYGDNYNNLTGVYTVPMDGLYLIHARLRGLDKDASHYIRVDGDQATYTTECDPAYDNQSSSTSIVIHLVAEQEVTVDPRFTGTIHGDTAPMYSSFGITLMYPD